MSQQQPPRGAPAQPSSAQALVQTGSGPLAVTKWNMTGEQIDLLKRTICRGSDDDEFALFMTVAQRMGLDPFARQIHAVKRYDTALDREVMAIQIGIDGYRLGAARTQEDDGQEGPFWCGPDRVWHDVWLSDSEPPVAAKVLVYRKGRARPYVGIAHWASYLQTTKKGEPTAMWRRHGPGQLAKCAEALALRKAFPAELGGTNTDDELGRDAIDAEFTELRPLPIAAAAVSPSAAAVPTSAGAATSSSSPATQAGSAAAPASSAKPAGPPPGVPHPPAAPTPLTDDEIIELIEELSRCGTKAALTVWRKQRCEPALARATDAQRERLARAAEGQLAEIELAKAGG